MGCVQSVSGVPVDPVPPSDAHKEKVLLNELAMAMGMVFSSKGIPLNFGDQYCWVSLVNHKYGMFKVEYPFDLLAKMSDDERTEYNDVKNFVDGNTPEKAANFLGQFTGFVFDPDEKIGFSYRETCLAISNYGIALNHQKFERVHVLNEFYTLVDESVKQGVKPKLTTILVHAMKVISEEANIETWKKEDAATAEQMAATRRAAYSQAGSAALEVGLQIMLA